MERSEVKKIVEKHVKQMMLDIGIPHWNVTIEYDRLPYGVKASCDLDRAKYWAADLTIDHEKMDDKGDVLHCLRHELLHILAAPFQHYRAVMTAGIDHESQEGEREIELWRFAMEQHVLILEKALASEVGR